jgi:hypothetical protein
VMAIRRRKGQLLAMIRGWGRWYPVESVTIEMRVILPNRRVSPGYWQEPEVGGAEREGCR